MPFPRRISSTASRVSASDGGVLQTWSATPLQPVIHPQDDVPSAFCAVKDAGAIAEPARRLGQHHNAVFFQVERAHRLDRVGDLLPIGANVLHRRAPDAARNTAQALDSGAILHDRLGDEVIPVDACAHAEEHGVAGGVIRSWTGDSSDRDSQHQPRPAGIGDDQVASAAQHKQRQFAGFRELRGLPNVVFSPQFRKVACRPAHLQGGQWRQRNVFLNRHEANVAL